MDKGFNYLIYEEKYGDVYRLFLQLTSDGSPGMIISTTFPDKLNREFGLNKSNIYWLSSTVGQKKDMLHPKRLDFEIAKTISAFIRDSKGGIVVIDGLGYLVLENGMESVRKFLKNINDIASMNGATLLVPVNLEMFSKELLATLSKDFDRCEDAKKALGSGEGEKAKPQVVQQTSVAQPISTPQTQVQPTPSVQPSNCSTFAGIATRPDTGTTATDIPACGTAFQTSSSGRFCDACRPSDPGRSSRSNGAAGRGACSSRQVQRSPGMLSPGGYRQSERCAFMVQHGRDVPDAVVYERGYPVL